MERKWKFETGWLPSFSHKVVPESLSDAPTWGPFFFFFSSSSSLVLWLISWTVYHDPSGSYRHMPDGSSKNVTSCSPSEPCDGGSHNQALAFSVSLIRFVRNSCSSPFFLPMTLRRRLCRLLPRPLLGHVSAFFPFFCPRMWPKRENIPKFPTNPSTPCCLFSEEHFS